VYAGAGLGVVSAGFCYDIISLQLNSFDPKSAKWIDTANTVLLRADFLDPPGIAERDKSGNSKFVRKPSVSKRRCVIDAAFRNPAKFRGRSARNSQGRKVVL